MHMWCFGENHFLVPPWALTYAPYVGKKNDFSKIVIYLCNLSLNILEILRMCTHVGNNAYVSISARRIGGNNVYVY